jgi:hypothetical protein
MSTLAYVIPSRKLTLFLSSFRSANSSPTSSVRVPIHPPPLPQPRSTFLLPQTLLTPPRSTPPITAPRSADVADFTVVAAPFLNHSQTSRKLLFQASRRSFERERGGMEVCSSYCCRQWESGATMRVMVGGLKESVMGSRSEPALVMERQVGQRAQSICLVLIRLFRSSTPTSTHRDSPPSRSTPHLQPHSSPSPLSPPLPHVASSLLNANNVSIPFLTLRDPPPPPFPLG